MSVAARKQASKPVALYQRPHLDSAAAAVCAEATFNIYTTEW